MKIEGLTVCVDYAKEFSMSIDLWELDYLVVVTSHEDTDTQDLCAGRKNIHVHRTNAFTRNGAFFNKGRAMEEGLDLWAFDDWCLFFDADIIPPDGWRKYVVGAEPGYLYGANRWQVPVYSGCLMTDAAKKIQDNEFPGFFQMWHSSDKRAQGRPLLDTHWTHAGNYDSTFQARWGYRYDQKMKRRLGVRLIHIGQFNQNWFGRGNKREMQKMYRERIKRGGLEAPGALDGERIASGKRPTNVRQGKK